MIIMIEILHWTFNIKSYLLNVPGVYVYAKKVVKNVQDTLHCVPVSLLALLEGYLLFAESKRHFTNWNVFKDGRPQLIFRSQSNKKTRMYK